MKSLEYLDEIRVKCCITWREMAEICEALGFVASDNGREQAENFMVELEEICYNDGIEV